MAALHQWRWHRAVAAHMDGELGGEARRKVAVHLNRCWDCSGDAETLRLIKHALRQIGERQPTDLATARLRRWVDAEGW